MSDEETPPAQQEQNEVDYKKLYEEAEARRQAESQILQNSIQAFQDLKEEVTKLKETPAPSNTPITTAEDFFQDPNAGLQNLETRILSAVEKKMQEIMAPLHSDIATRQRQQAMDAIFAQAAVHPQLKNIWPQIQHKVREILSSAPQVDVPTFTNAVYMAQGMLALSGSPTQTPSTPPVIPPHIPSNAPPPAPPKSSAPLRQLTELEERIRRENNMTVEEYIQLTDDKTPLSAERK